MPAYFLTWTCHGTRLHGDERGTVDRNHNRVGAPDLDPDPIREKRNFKRLASPPITLCDESRRIVDDTIRRHCDIRGWKLLALNARTTHIHVVVHCNDKATPEAAMEQFKAWSTRKLREAGLASPDQKVWTEHGSTRWVDTDASLSEAIHYVTNCQ